MAIGTPGGLELRGLGLAGSLALLQPRGDGLLFGIIGFFLKFIILRDVVVFPLVPKLLLGNEGENLLRNINIYANIPSWTGRLSITTRPSGFGLIASRWAFGPTMPG
jgi:hypothetical protein